MACCLPFTVSVGAGGVGFTQLAGLGTSTPLCPQLVGGESGGRVPPTFCPQSLAVVQVPGPLMGSWVGQVGKGACGLAPGPLWGWPLP